MTIQDKIRKIIIDNKVVLFMKGTKQFPQCGFSGKAVKILIDSGCKDFLAVNVLEDDNLREGIKKFSDWPTIPQLYINGEFIGGSDIMQEIFEEGEMQELLC